MREEAEFRGVGPAQANRYGVKAPSRRLLAPRRPIGAAVRTTPRPARPRNGRPPGAPHAPKLVFEGYTQFPPSAAPRVGVGSGTALG